MNAETTFEVPQGVFALRRLPESKDASLRAWDAADSYALEHVWSLPNSESSQDALGGTPLGSKSVLIINDLFGGLAVALHQSNPQSWSDSVTSHQATIANLERNGLDPESVDLVRSTDDPVGPIDVVIIKVPRSLALLEDQLVRLRPLLHADSVIIGSGMVKSIHSSTLDLFGRLLGPSPTSLAKRKARLIFAELDTTRENVGGNSVSSYQLPTGQTMVEHANVFSRGRLDIGTRAMLDNLPKSRAGDAVLDLGCGNGVLGLTLAKRGELSRLVFADESYQAVASARANVEGWGISAPTEYITDRTLQTVTSSSIDLVVCNPPFHTHQSRSDDTARSMFSDAHRVLKPGGRLVVVGNRHLAYHQLMKRRFGSCDSIGSTPKFVVLSSTRV